MNTQLSHDLLIRAEIGGAWEIPVLQEWNVSVSEKLTIKQAGAATQKIVKEFGEVWTLFTENSFATNNNIYGIWKQKLQKFQISLDPEEIRERLIESLSNDLTREIVDLIVTKIIFTGNVATDETIKGTLKIFAKISFFDSDASAKVTIEKKFTGIPVELLESVTAVVQ